MLVVISEAGVPGQEPVPAGAGPPGVTAAIVVAFGSCFAAPGLSASSAGLWGWAMAPAVSSGRTRGRAKGRARELLWGHGGTPALLARNAPVYAHLQLYPFTNHKHIRT